MTLFLILVACAARNGGLDDPGYVPPPMNDTPTTPVPTGPEADDPTAQDEAPATMGERSAFAALEPAQGGTVSGSVTFTETYLDAGLTMPDDPIGFTDAPPSETRIRIELEGAQPGDVHVRLHETGSCGGDPGAPLDLSGGAMNGGMNDAGGAFGDGAAGGGSSTGGVGLAEGDLGTVVIGPDGTGRKDLTLRNLTIGEGPRSLLGRTVFVRAGVGESGGRVLSCGVIGGSVAAR